MPDGRQRLVYLHSVADSNVWRFDTSASGTPVTAPPVSAIASTRHDLAPSLSPDGQRLAFISNRSGDYGIWVAGVDGSRAVQLTSMPRMPGYPRWSPDGKLIVFHGDHDGRPEVVLVPAAGGKPVSLSTDPSNARYPRFSRDGRWIYFSSFQNGESRIWKMPASGGTAVQVTNTEGAVAIESYDGDLYYLEAVDLPSAVWRMPRTGGAPVKVLDGVVLGSFDVVEGGIYYIDRAPGERVVASIGRPGGERLQYLDFGTGRSTTVAHNLGTLPFGLSASRDGRTIFFCRADSAIDELMVVDNFR